MLFVWMGFLKSSDPIDPAVQQQIGSFLQQPYIPIKSAGLLRSGAGDRAGYLMIFEAEIGRLPKPWSTKARFARPVSTANSICSNIKTRWGDAAR